ncbi:CAP domain-containing protein [Sporomusa sphaeroides DSM 2875]|uniref:CAP domain-containing protein n=1 Tax=Sporomusa sphaeroides TaxID=47679 RepID=UPI00202EEC43|nr:CAP domain-containing protein [Sporomusa sphaeroides]MCM0757330.1 CAP domain-containing protein [Sporomusa sphaeroides DSM 2875]
MFKRKLCKTLTLSFLTLSLVTTSWGGAWATAQSAAADEQTTEITAPSNGTTNTILGGLLAIGLIAALTNHGDNSDGAAPAKGTASSPPAATPTRSAPQAPQVSGVTADEQLAVNLLNADRAANGLPPLKLNLAVTAVARQHAQDQIDRNFFAHVNPDGKSPFDRMRSAGISFGYAGENLAINRNVTAAEQAFMNSPGHRANILNPKYKQVGIGVRYSPQGSVYVVQNFID